MMTIKERVDGYIDRIRADEEAADVTFLYGFPATGIPNPVTSCIAAVYVADADVTADNGHDALTLVLRVYVPRNRSGTELTEVCEGLMRSARRADDGTLVGIHLSAMSFENATRVLYRDVRITLSFIDDTDTCVSVDGGAVEGFCSIEVERVDDTDEIREMLSAEPVAVLSSSPLYRIRLSVYSSRDTLDLGGTFTLSVSVGETDEVYEGCTLTGVTRRYGVDTKNIYTLTAKTMTRSERDER